MRVVLLPFILLFFAGCQSTDNASVAPEGWVRLTFDIDEKGTTQNIEVIESQPVGIFEQEAIRALSSWKYKPKVVDGKAVFQTEMEVKLDFRLEKEN